MFISRCMSQPRSLGSGGAHLLLSLLRAGCDLRSCTSPAHAASPPRVSRSQRGLFSFSLAASACSGGGVRFFRLGLAASLAGRRQQQAASPLVWL